MLRHGASSLKKNVFSNSIHPRTNVHGILESSNNLYLILAIVLSLPAAYALLHKGFYGASDDLHIAWLYEMDKILKIGQIPPRYVPDLSFGFGYPLFNFVFPLPYYIGEIFRLFNFSFVDGVKIVFGISFVASGVTMFYFLNEILPGAFALAGSLIYCVFIGCLQS